jgi:3-oxoacyl-[acyl-carrier protein] reductase
VNLKPIRTFLVAADITNSLAGQWAFVTGSSGGIGAAIARELAASGANVILHGHRHLDNAEKLAQELRTFSVAVDIVAADLADAKERDRVAEKAWSIAPIDVVVNSAGADVLTGEAADWPFPQKLSALWEVDVQATIALSRALGTRMKDRGAGSIINIGWSQSESGMAGESGEYFGAVKSAVAAFTKSLAKSLAPQVRVNCLAPGWIQTKWGEAASEYWQNRAKSESMLQRWGQPEDVARVVRFLVSLDGAFINGQVINVDGGFAGSFDDRGWS